MTNSWAGSEIHPAFGPSKNIALARLFLEIVNIQEIFCNSLLLWTHQEASLSGEPWRIFPVCHIRVYQVIAKAGRLCLWNLAMDLRVKGVFPLAGGRNTPASLCRKHRFA
jgi:hypothetical protein